MHYSLLHAKSFNETSKVYSTGGNRKTKLKGKSVKTGLFSTGNAKKRKKEKNLEYNLKIKK